MISVADRVMTTDDIASGGHFCRLDVRIVLCGESVVSAVDCNCLNYSTSSPGWFTTELVKQQPEESRVGSHRLATRVMTESAGSGTNSATRLTVRVAQ